jgi:DNA-binding winged helix-turn-helix (wHTH) protein/TolB-like protein
MSCLKFGDWTFDADSGQLSSSEADSRLRPQSAEVLRLLIEQAPELVSRDAIQAQLWPGDVIVDYDTGINACIKQIRKALGSSAGLIKTIPKKGFRLQTEANPLPSHRQPRLQRPSPITALMVMIVLCLIFMTRSNEAPLAPALAIMPFAMISGDSSSAALNQQLHNALMLHLSDQARMPLVSARSVHSLSDESLDTPTLGKRLNAHYIIEGQLRRLSQSHMLMLSLSDSRSGYVLWSQLLEIHDQTAQLDTARMLQAVVREIDLVQTSLAP